MSVLLRHPATVPALFSRSVDPELQSDRVRAPWYRVSRGSPLALTGRLGGRDPGRGADRQGRPPPRWGSPSRIESGARGALAPPALRRSTLTLMGPQRPTPTITPQILLRAYSVGLFPMSEGADDPSLFWLDPEMRGIFPLDGMVVSTSLSQDGPARSLLGRRRPRLRRRDRGLRRGDGGPARDLDQRRDPHDVPRALRHGPRAHGRGL